MLLIVCTLLQVCYVYCMSDCSLDDDGHRNADSNHFFFLSLPFLSGSAASAAFCAASSVSSILQHVDHTLIDHASGQCNNMPLRHMCILDSGTLIQNRVL